MTTYPPASLAWLIWSLAAIFYIMGFYQRLAPAVMTDILMADLQIGAAALGNLSAFYFYSYVAMQIPTGILADRWGPRKLLTAGALTASLGTFVFAGASTFYMASLGRFLIGGSVAVAWVAMLKLVAHWFPPSRFATVTGIALACGVLGAVGAGIPLRLLVDFLGWRPVFYASAVATLFITLLIYLFTRDDPREHGYLSYAPGQAVTLPEGTAPRVWTSIRTVFKYPNTWLLVLAPSGIVGPLLTFTGLWGVPYLTTHYGFSTTEAAGITSTILIAWALGGPCLGGLSDRLGLRKIVYLSGASLAALGWAFILMVPDLPLYAMIFLAALTGFASGSMVLGFAFLRESVPYSLGGTSSGILNAGVMMGPVILQPSVGIIMDLHWHGETAGGVRLYDLAAYQYGFSILVLAAVMAVVMIFFTRETYCQHREN